MGVEIPKASLVKSSRKYEWPPAVLNMLLFLGALACFGLTVHERIHNRILATRTLHTFEDGNPPSQYLALDWIMRPEYNEIGYKVQADSCEECVSGNCERCSPKSWQMSSICQKLEGTTFDSHGLEDNQEKQFFADSKEDGLTLNKAAANGIEAVNQLQRKIVLATCKSERTPSLLNIQNSHESYGLFGTHSWAVIVTFVSLILVVLSFFLFISRHIAREYDKIDNNETFSLFDWEMFKSISASYKNNRARNYLVVVVITTYIVYVIFNLAQPREVLLGTTPYLAPGLNASFAYGSFYFFVYSLFAIILLSGKVKSLDELKIYKHLAGEMAPEASMAGEMPPMPPGMNAQLGYVNSSAASATTKAPLNFGLKSVSTTAVMDQTAASLNEGTTEFDKIEMKDSGGSDFGLLYFFTFPLWILFTYLYQRGFVVDSKLQYVFLTALGYAAIEYYYLNLEKIAAMFKMCTLTHEKIERVRTGGAYSSLLFVITFQVLLTVILYTELQKDNHNLQIEFGQNTGKNGDKDAYSEWYHEIWNVIFVVIWLGVSTFFKLLSFFYYNIQHKYGTQVTKVYYFGEVSSDFKGPVKNVKYMYKVLHFVYIISLFLGLFGVIIQASGEFGNNKNPIKFNFPAPADKLNQYLDNNSNQFFFKWYSKYMPVHA